MAGADAAAAAAAADDDVATGGRAAYGGYEGCDMVLAE